jgi:tetratricopeptide (TPR) repeat protein
MQDFFASDDAFPEEPDGLGPLVELLGGLFNANELRRFVALLPEGALLGRALPGDPVPLDTLAFEAVHLLRRRGLIRTALFDALRNTRPGRAEDIEAVQALFERSTRAQGGAQDEAVAPEHEPETPYLEWFVGRDALADDLAARLIRGAPRPIAVLGPGGMGKSTLAVAAMHRGQVVERFGARRYFVRLDGAPSADAALERVGRTLGLSGPIKLAEVRARLASAPALLVLDNLETPWDQDRARTEALLAQLGNLPGTALVVTLRGNERPAGLAWDRAMHVKRLAHGDARELFCAIAEPDAPDDPAVDALVRGLDGVPLAIVLLARRAQGAVLSELCADWNEKRAELLSRPGMSADRLTSWAVSVELSWTSPRMTEPARRLASLLALLPDGLALDDVAALLPEHGRDAARVLDQVSLTYVEEGRRRMLAPIREHLAAVHPPAGGDLARCMEHYRALATEFGPRPGRDGGAEAVARLAPETANLDAMIRRGLDTDDPVPWIDAACALTEFVRFSGHASLSPLAAAAEVAARMENRPLQAKCIFSMGEIALARSEHEQARACFEQALSLYGQVGDLGGQANCIKSMGNIALARSEHEQARACFEQALPLYRQIGFLRGQANCIKSIGNIALEQSDHEQARAWFEVALPLYRQAGALLGQANCIKSMGDIALRRSEHEQARACFEQALPLYQQIGALLGQANCIIGMGDIALRRSEHEQAQVCYEQALSLYQQVGDLLGQANCIKSMGDIALARSEHEQARAWFEQALVTYGRIPDAYAMGWTERRVARLCDEPAERARHVAEARRLWTAIDRPDLVADLDREFGTSD